MVRVSFEFQHNVCGHKTYAEGTVDAAIFIHKKVPLQISVSKSYIKDHGFCYVQQFNQHKFHRI